MVEVLGTGDVAREVGAERLEQAEVVDREAVRVPDRECGRGLGAGGEAGPLGERREAVVRQREAGVLRNGAVEVLGGGGVAPGTVRVLAAQVCLERAERLRRLHRDPRQFPVRRLDPGDQQVGGESVDKGEDLVHAGLRGDACPRRLGRVRRVERCVHADPAPGVHDPAGHAVPRAEPLADRRDPFRVRQIGPVSREPALQREGVDAAQRARPVEREGEELRYALREVTELRCASEREGEEGEGRRGAGRGRTGAVVRRSRRSGRRRRGLVTIARRPRFGRADPFDQLPRRGGWRGLVIALEATGQLLVDVQRAGAIADAGQEIDQPSDRRLVVRHEFDCSARPPRRGDRVIDRRLGERPCRARGHRLEPCPLFLDPALDLQRAIDVGAAEELAPVEVDGVAEALLGDGLPERGDVAPEPRGVDPQLLVATADDDIAAERAPEVVDRLAERRPRPLLLELGPEQAEERVATAEAARRGREVGEQDQALGLGQDGAELGAVGRAEVDGPEDSESDHLNQGVPPARSRVVPAWQQDNTPLRTSERPLLQRVN